MKNQQYRIGIITSQVPESIVLKMFTGIIEQQGTVSAVEQNQHGATIEIVATSWEDSLKKGESIAVSGCCLTLVHSVQNEEQLTMTFDVIPESLSATTFSHIAEGTKVNLERAVKSATRMGGHVVQGHVNHVTSVQSISKTAADEHRVVLTLLPEMKSEMTLKGCVTIDGVSLTIASIKEDCFEVALIPETLKATTLGSLSEHQQVNIETDIFTRTVAELVEQALKTKQLSS